MVSLRARCAQWFELLVPRHNVAHALEILADSGVVELDGSIASGEREDFSHLTEGLADYQRLRRDYEKYLPLPQFRPAHENVVLESTFGRALANLGRWESEAQPIIRCLEVHDAGRHETARLRDFLVTVKDDQALDFTLLVNGDLQTCALFVLAADAAIPDVAETILVRRSRTAYHTYLLMLGPTRMIRSLVDALGGTRVRPVALPSWLRGDPSEARITTERRLIELDKEIHQERARVARLAEKHDVAYSLGDIARLRWVVEQIDRVPMTRYMASVTGWTSDPVGLRILRPLQAAGIPSVLDLPDVPEGRMAPTLTDNPVWARPYELFVKLIGTPGRDETDPSGLLALIVPVLFGYMFGDVGHGAVLIVVGFLLRRRWPATAILIPAGLMAVIFGLVFGSVFTREDLLHPLWVNPLADPVSVLMAPFWGGAVLISLGLLLSGLAAHWSGDLRGWLRVEAGLLVAYLGALAVLVETDAILVSAFGVFWYVTGNAYESRQEGLMSLLGGIGELAERLLQLAVNTVSFVRVGAFALAHAGLAMAVASLAAATGSTASGLLVLVIGNLTILALEGLIVGIQTTRLVLFEFFVRFVRAEGREFRPLKPPLGVQIAGAGA